MSRNKLLLDTNIIIDFFAGDKLIIEKIANDPNFNISVITLGELYIGINRVHNKMKQLQRLRSFLLHCSIVTIYNIKAEYFGAITAELYKKGKPIPTNDVWIAASVKQRELTLISRDKHFNEISALKSENW